MDNMCERKKERCGKAPTSYYMHDANLVFTQLDIKEGENFLDLGCGAGDYSIKASEIVGESGNVYAVDKSAAIFENSNLINRKNIKTIIADISQSIPVDDKKIDICLLSTVLHAMDLNKCKDKLFSEIKRILKPNGRLAIIECKKEISNFGPPFHMRISALEIDEMLKQYDFVKVSAIELGINYMIQFVL